jgi:hypothetical protein
MKLTAKAIASLSLPADKADVIYFDDTMPGFGLRLRRNGDRVGKSWLFNIAALALVAGFCLVRPRC